MKKPLPSGSWAVIWRLLPWTRAPFTVVSRSDVSLEKANLNISVHRATGTRVSLTRRPGALGALRDVRCGLIISFPRRTSVGYTGAGQGEEKEEQGRQGKAEAQVHARWEMRVCPHLRPMLCLHFSLVVSFSPFFSIIQKIFKSNHFGVTGLRLPSCPPTGRERLYKRLLVLFVFQGCCCSCSSGGRGGGGGVIMLMVAR